MNTFQLPKKFNFFLLTESLGAFNDNFLKMLIQLFVLVILKRKDADALIGQAAFVFTLPFVIFGPWAGWLSDRFCKSRLMQIIKSLEVLIAALALFAFYQNSIPFLFFVLFCMATHSAFFAPAKAGFIPEVVPAELITKANSWVNLTTFLSIILGTALVGLFLNLHHNKVVIVCLYSLGVAMLGTFSSFFLPKTQISNSSKPFPLNPLRGIMEDLKHLKASRGIFLASLALSYFWLLGLIFQTNILVYGAHELGLNETQNVQLAILPALMGIGIAFGSLLASRWSGKKVELGLTPLGGFGLTLSAILLKFSNHSYPFTLILLLIAGISAALFITPLISFLQFEAPPNEKGRILASNGILNGLFLVLGSLLYNLFVEHLHLQPSSIFFIMGIFTLGVTFYICYVIPEYFVRFLAWLLTHTFYRIKIIGAENVPLEGSVLLTPNHVTFVDALLLNATIQRFIKFIMYKKIYEVPFVNFICKLMEVIPIAPYEGKESVTQSLALARQKLIDGAALCIFPEGQVTRHGEMNEFRRGFESIMKDLDYPIIPIYMHNVWGSIFSFEGGKVFWKFPKKIPYPITITFGEAMPANSTAEQVEEAVKKLKENLNPA